MAGAASAGAATGAGAATAATATGATGAATTTPTHHAQRKRIHSWISHHDNSFHFFQIVKIRFPCFTLFQILIIPNNHQAILCACHGYTETLHVLRETNTIRSNS